MELCSQSDYPALSSLVLLFDTFIIKFSIFAYLQGRILVLSIDYFFPRGQQDAELQFVQFYCKEKSFNTMQNAKYAGRTHMARKNNELMYESAESASGGAARANPALSSIWNLIYNINNNQEMRYSERNTGQKRPYSKISLKKREQLVKYVIADHVSISKAAKRIKIKLTTARLIVKKYKETGTYPMKKFKEAVPVQEEINHNQQIQMREALEANKFQQEEILSEQLECIPSLQICCNPPSEYAGRVIFYYFWPYNPYEASF